LASSSALASGSSSVMGARQDSARPRFRSMPDSSWEISKADHPSRGAEIPLGTLRYRPSLRAATLDSAGLKLSVPDRL
jgi:hypothetical protein